jgi:hypothetical protein
MRSSIPKVVGILMIIFASLGLLGGLIGLGGHSSSAGLNDIPAWKTFNTLSMVVGVIGLGISVLHLIAGIRSVGYKANAPKLAMMYATVNIIVTLGWGIVVFAWLKPAIEKVAGGIGGAAIGVGVMFGVIISIAWPVIVLALMTRPAAKQACTN